MVLDYDVADSSLIENWVKDMDSEKVSSIVAVLEGRIIALSSLIRKYYGSKSHIGKIRISVDPFFREKHLETWMLLDLINLAMTIGLETLTLELMKKRDSFLINSLENLAFFAEAVLNNYVRDREGNPYSLVIMVKHFHRGWEDRGIPSP